MTKLSLLTTAFTATESLPASTWPHQPTLPSSKTWQRLRRRFKDTLKARRDDRRFQNQLQALTEGRPLTFGSLAAPLPLSSWQKEIEPLKLAPAGALRLIAQVDQDLEDLTALLEIDQHHALQIDLILNVEELTDFDRPTWRMARALSDLGIAVRLGFHYVPDASDQEFHLYRLFETALKQGAFDLFPVAAATPRTASPTERVLTSWLANCERLRLEYSCPREIVSRG